MYKYKSVVGIKIYNKITLAMTYLLNVIDFVEYLMPVHWCFGL